jgi:hypothetical protein
MAAKMERTQHPGIFKRGSRYAVSYRVNGKQKWESARTLAEARKVKRSRESAADSGEFFEASRESFRNYAGDWVERYQGNGRRGFTDNTRDEYRRDLGRYAYPRIGDRGLAAITPRDVSNLIAWLCDEEALARAPLPGLHPGDLRPPDPGRRGSGTRPLRRASGC